MTQAGIFISIEAIGGFVSGTSHQDQSTSNTMPSRQSEMDTESDMESGEGTPALSEQEKRKQKDHSVKRSMGLVRGMANSITLTSHYARTQLFSTLKYKVTKRHPLNALIKGKILMHVGFAEEDVETKQGNAVWDKLEGVVTDALLSRRNSVQHGVKLKVKSECNGCFVNVEL